MTASGEPVEPPLALLVLVGGWFAWVLLPQSFTGFTPGKAVFGIRAFAATPAKSRHLRALLIKSLAELVWLIPLVFVASCVTIFGKRRRTIPDMIAKTSVVRHAPAAATRWASGALAVLVLAATTGYGYVSVWRPAAGIGNNWETLDSFYDADEVRAEILSDPDVSDYDMVVFRDSDVPVWDIIYSRGGAVEHATLDDELWDDFLMIDCYWFSDDPAGSPGVAFDWPVLPASGAGVELSWSASSGSAGRAVGLMSYGPRSETQAPSAWIADPGLAEADIRDNLQAEGYAPEELEVPIVLRGFYEALLTADTITLDVGGSRHTWVLPEDAQPLHDLMRRCAHSTAAATQPTPSSAAPPSNTATAGADVGDCDFADRAATVRAAVFQVVTPDGTGTAFHIGDGEWLTAAHVVANQTRVSLRNGSATIAATVKGAT